MNALIVVVFPRLRDWIPAWFRTRTEIIAENLFLRRQLAPDKESKVRRRRSTLAAKLKLVLAEPGVPFFSRCCRLLKVSVSY